jgi:hypothetical protein
MEYLSIVGAEAEGRATLTDAVYRFSLLAPSAPLYLKTPSRQLLVCTQYSTQQDLRARLLAVAAVVLSLSPTTCHILKAKDVFCRRVKSIKPC